MSVKMALSACGKCIIHFHGLLMSSSTVFDTTLAALGGWPGVAAFLFISLAFPICHAARTRRAHEREHFRHQATELRIASLLLVLGAVLCATVPAEIYLHPHVIRGQHIYARAADWTLGYLIIYVVGPLLGFFRSRHIASSDQRGLEATIPDEQLNNGDTPTTSKRLTTTLQANLFATQTWTLLTISHATTIASALLTIAASRLLHDMIPWWHIPLIFNTLPHVALLLSVIGLIDAFSHPFRTDVWERALHCETPEARRAHWQWVRRTTVSPGHAFRTLVMLRWRRRAEDGDVESAVAVDGGEGRARTGMSCATESMSLGTLHEPDERERLLEADGRHG